MNQETRSWYNAQNVINLISYWPNQGPIIDEDNEFAAYISSFEGDVKLPMENYPWIQEQQQKFLDAITKCEMRHCTSFYEK